MRIAKWITDIPRLLVFVLFTGSMSATAAAGDRDYKAALDVVVLAGTFKVQTRGLQQRYHAVFEGNPCVLELISVKTHIDSKDVAFSSIALKDIDARSLRLDSEKGVVLSIRQELIRYLPKGDRRGPDRLIPLKEPRRAEEDVLPAIRRLLEECR